jgi:hypothetical protein
MIIGNTPVPKRELIELVIKNIPDYQIRNKLKIQSATDIRNRLDDFSKKELLIILTSNNEGRIALENSESNYPLSSNSTLYLISVNSWPKFSDLLNRTSELSEQKQNIAVCLDPDRTIRCIYMITKAKRIGKKINFQEIPLVYVKKIEYCIADPDSDNFGEISYLYSLEKAIIWYNNDYNHALLLCGDFQAVKPILYYGKSMLNISWQLPNLSENMLHQLAKGATPRTVSFSRIDDISNSPFDAKSLTISDPDLENLQSFNSLSSDKSREQTFGFYLSHPDLVYGGLGITRKYGRIWTPARLKKESLLSLSSSLIERTEKELINELDINTIGFIKFYRNYPVTLDGKKLNEHLRDFFDELVSAIIKAKRSQSLECNLNNDLIRSFLLQYEKLDLIPMLKLHCDNCGDILACCSICGSPLIPRVQNNEFIFVCPNHPQDLLLNDHSFACECGKEIEITFSSDLMIFPGARLLDSIHKFLDILENQGFDGNFVINGNILRVIPKKHLEYKFETNEYNLDQFHLWRNIAHIHQCPVSDKEKEEYRHLLMNIKEKCKRNNLHPGYETCNLCMNEKLTISRIKAGKELCLARVLGYAIDKNFNGVHHKYEIADVQYADNIVNSKNEVNIGIHLKSREKQRPEGLGRSVHSIKGLYTQYCYSAYLKTSSIINLDIIGISIPNIIKNEIRQNFNFLSNQFGIPLIILDEDLWLKILKSVFEKVCIDEAM